MNITLSKKYMPMFKDDENIFFYFLYGGRCGSKTFSAMTYVIYRMTKARETCVYCQQTKADLNTSAINEWENRLKDMGLWKSFQRSGNRYTYIPNGSTIVFKGFQTSSDAIETMKGFSNLSIAYVDEAQSTDEEAFDNLIGSIRSKKDMKLIVSLNPSDVNCYLYKRYFKELPSWDFSGIIDDKLYVYSSYEDVKEYIGASKIKVIEDIKKNDPIKFSNQYLGKWLENSEKAALTKELIEIAEEKVEIPNKYDKIIIAIDPAVSANKNSDDTGIVVVGKYNKNYYLLEDKSGIYEPSQWALIVKELYLKYKCNYVVYENNQGGLLVEQNIRNVCGHFMQIKSVRATKGKLIRWEPCRALYEQRLVHHLKHFEKLNYELLTYGTSLNDRSPGHLDSLCWGLTSLAESSNSGSLYAQ